MKKIILDTSAYSNLLKGSTKVLEIIDEAEIVFMSVIIIAELLTGFKGGNSETSNREILKRFLLKSKVQVIDANIETAEIFANVKYLLKSGGNPIPINDVWIAAHTIETGSVLITFDKHFHKVAGLRILQLE